MREAAERVADASPEGIDVLANNTGVLVCPDVATKDSVDIQMQVNHLSHFRILTKRLMPLLEAAPNGDPRVIQHSSLARSYPVPVKPLSRRYFAEEWGELRRRLAGVCERRPPMGTVYHQSHSPMQVNALANALAK